MDTRYYRYSPSYPEQAFGCTLVYSNQLNFERWARKHGLTKKNGVDYYFDYITAVDGRDPMKQSNIPGVLANGTLTWSEALEKLKAYFKVVA